MFPARAGMNRGYADKGFKSANVPRSRGDEPQTRRGGARGYVCSPLARG